MTQDAKDRASPWTIAARIWSRVAVGGKSECWPWQGGLSNGYPVISVDGRSVRVSRLAWSLANGQPFPDALLACHHCDNPPCCNPAHIFPGTSADNMHDMVAKGRNSSILKRQRATACAKGHPYTRDNTRTVIRDGSPRRICLTCQRGHNERWKARRAQAASVKGE